MPESYFIVLDQAPIKGSPTPTYDLMFGSPETAIGVHRESGHSIKGLLRKVPIGEPVYRTYVVRMDGKTGYKELKRDKGASQCVS